ncbi:hypothetical protein LA345_38770 (plasmid) [Burkholderia vietnamiensis]|uniref:Uncharacterized protein n=1 Tax=Burkholderia vietnamiensis (strain G4 / LMG 22486) TaxID=269482 RepID=A4JWB6_BURVG|nr:hypothetical protein Bcep1808_7699 [Burkholderia vietnamiensis G4]MCB4349742.1 hypothetical protein [Burkholderia vietnamiensis]
MDSMQEPPPTIITREQAAEQGLTRYFTGEACRNGHIAERNTKSRRCVECERRRAYASYKKAMQTDPAARRAAIAASVKRHYQRHAAEILAKKKKYYEENAEAIKKRMRDYRAAKNQQ